MSSHGKPKVTIDRAKALKFIIQQEFYKLEQLEPKEVHKNIQILEREWYQKAADNTAYVQQICTYAVQRHLLLLEQTIAKMSAKDPNRIKKISMRDYIKQRIQTCVNNKMVQFHQRIGLPPPFAHQPFIVGNAHIPMHPMHIRYPYSPMQQFHVNMSANNGNQSQPPKKRMKLSNVIPKRMIKKTKEEIENEKISKLKLPKNLINSHKLQQWLEEKGELLKEYESLIIKTYTNSHELEGIKSEISNLRRDIDILKSTVLQQNSNGLSQNKELKRVYLDIMKMDKDLPGLREQNIRPTIQKYASVFQKCEVRQTLQAQRSMKQLFSANKFEKRAEEYCKVSGKQFVRAQLFESEINSELNDDLELLRDFGVRFCVEWIHKSEAQKFDLKVIFPGHFESECMNVPSLVLMVNESKYRHYYEMLPSGHKLTERFVDFIFVLGKDSNGDDGDVEMVSKNKCLSFTDKHIKWLDNHKRNTLKSNGDFVSIVNIYNFYNEAIKTVLKEMKVTKPKLKIKIRKKRKTKKSKKN